MPITLHMQQPWPLCDGMAIAENRYAVFQSLTHTLNWSAPRWRVLDAAHQKRNLAEYEGFLEVEESAIAELSELVSELIADVTKLVG